VVRAERLLRLPDAIDDRTAASMMLKGMTVEYLIRRVFPVEKGMPVLFHAAAGGVGLIACQWLAHLGAEVIGTVGTEEKAEIARQHGCHHPIVYRSEDFVARTKEITGGQGVPVVYDSVGKETLQGSLDCLARRGMLVSFGNASGKPAPLDLLDLSRRGSLFATRPVLWDYTQSVDDLHQSARRLFEVVAEGVVRIRIGQTFPLEKAAWAHRALEERQTTGSTLLIPRGDR
jgi:NADPH2:quinone reductase